MAQGDDREAADADCRGEVVSAPDVIPTALVKLMERASRKKAREDAVELLDLLSATVPHPQRRTGVLHRSRRVPGGVSIPRGRNRLPS